MVHRPAPARWWGYCNPTRSLGALLERGGHRVRMTLSTGLMGLLHERGRGSRQVAIERRKVRALARDADAHMSLS